MSPASYFSLYTPAPLPRLPLDACPSIRILEFYKALWTTVGGPDTHRAVKGPTGKGPRREFRVLISAGKRHDTRRAEKDLQGGGHSGGVLRIAAQLV